MTLTIGSLFSGIGGLELGLERAGLGPVLWQVECDPFCRSVLAKHWPNATRYDDVRTAQPPPADVLCGGFPCQDISDAGKRAGIGGERSGLWEHFARLIGVLRPRYVVVENVSALLSRGMGRVLGDLAALGYDAEWSSLRASDVGAPHRRERIFIVAHAAGQRRARSGKGRECAGVDAAGANCPMAHAAEPRREGPDGCREPPRERRPPIEPERLGDAWCDGGAPKSRLGGSVDGLPSWLDRWPAGPGEAQHAWEPPRTVQGKSVNRPARLRALGNAVVPRCAEVVGREILAIATPPRSVP
jgi:DNA (cytosine-5)-methyltransferase 1